MQSCTLMVILWCLLLCTLSVAQESSSPTSPTSNATVKTPFGVDDQKNAKIEHVKKTIDSPVEDIQWVNDEIVFVLSQDGSVYLSTDSGRSWQQQNRHMSSPGSVMTSHSIQSIFVSKADHTHVFFLGKTRDNWVTTNGGTSYQHSKLTLSDIRLHPTQKNLILGSGQSEGCQTRLSNTMQGTNADHFCFKRLYISRDFGINWDPLVDYVVQFEWSPAIGHADKNGRRISDDWIYATVNREKNGDQKSGFWDKNVDFLISRDFFKSYQVLVPHGNRFLFGEHAFLFVAAVNPQSDQQVFLMISRDNKTHSHFAQAQLPVTLTEHSYTILDTSEGTVFLHVNHQPFGEYAYAGHVYVSDWSGIYYTLSLPYNHRSADGKCDFEKVEGLEGIYLSNFIDEEDMDKFEQEQAARGIAVERATRRNRLRTKTVISFDKGGEWHFLKAPTEDSLGVPIKCDGCSLHLHGITDPHGPFYTTKAATGIVMGTGSVGQYLQDNADQINTYLSRDAGVTWKEVAKGTHIYEFGNHGGLIVMAEDNRATKDIMYSWNEGLHWQKLEVSEENIMIENIVIEPKSESQAFLIYGTTTLGTTQGVIIYVDFSEMHERQCTGHDTPDASASDYETWTPNDGRLNKCLMGHTVTYTRRKPDHECFTPEGHERPQFVQHCPCVASDFECDYGYQRASKTLVSSTSASDCVKMASAPTHTDPAKHIYYGDKCIIRQTKGYRRVPGDTCVGGAQWDANEISCDSSSSSWTKIIFFILVVIILVFAGVTLFSKYDNCGGYVVQFQMWLRKRGQGKEGYDHVDRHHAPETPEDDGLDQNFFLDDDDHQSARLLESNTKGKGAQDAQKAGSKKAKKGSSDKDKEIVFRGLPPSRQTTSEVHAPALAPPPGTSSNV